MIRDCSTKVGNLYKRSSGKNKVNNRASIKLRILVIAKNTFKGGKKNTDGSNEL